MKTVRTNAGSDQQARYRITVRGRVAESWSDWFQGLTIEPERDTTTLTGYVVDQAALRGLLCRVWDLNLTVVSIIRLEHETTEKSHE